MKISKLPFVDPRVGRWPKWLHRGKVAHDPNYAEARDWLPARPRRKQVHGEWAKWRLSPYGAYHEYAGSIVIFDRQYTQSRGYSSGRRAPEAVDPEERISFYSQSFFHPGHWKVTVRIPRTNPWYNC